MPSHFVDPIAYPNHGSGDIYQQNILLHTFDTSDFRTQARRGTI